MKKTIVGSLFMACALTAGAQYLPNSSFDTWKTTNGKTTQTAGEGSSAVRPGTEPEGWNGSNITQVIAIKGCVTKPSDGDYVKIANYNMFGQIIPGYMTLATPWVFVGGSDLGEMLQLAKYGDGGSYGSTSFTYKPDAISLKYRRTGGTGETSHVIAYLWSGTFKSGVPTSVNTEGVYTYGREMEDVDRVVMGRQTENVSQQGTLIASLDYEITDDQTEWSDLIIPFTYQNTTDAPEKMNVILAASDYWTRPNLKGGTTLDVDDVQFVYYSELASLTYNDESMKIPSDGTIDLSDQVYDASKLSYTLTGKGATADRRYNAQTGVLTLTVKGNDWSEDNKNQHVYSIQFAEPVPASEAAGLYNSLIKVNLLGNVVPSINDVELNEETDGSLTFAMKNFSFMGANVGDVMLKNATLSRADDGSINIVASADPVALAEGAIHAKVDVTGNVKQTGDERELTATVNIGWYSAYPNTETIVPIVAEVSPAPFSAELNGRTLAVTGKVDADVAALVIPTGSEVGSVDLTEVELGDGLATSDFGSDLGNTLFFISGSQALSGNNVVKDGACANLVLTDGQPFYAPEAFTAGAISYNRTDLVANEIYTFVLPFAVSTEQVNGAVYELASITDGVISFAPVSDGTLEANKPYLVRATGTTLLADGASISGEVEAVTEATVENAVTGVTHVGAYQTTEVASEGATSWYGYNQKGTFVKATTGTISPFRTALCVGGNGQSSYVLSLDGTITGIVSATGDVNARVDVYTLSGVCVRKNVPAATALDGLDRGIYIVGGQKVSK